MQNVAMEMNLSETAFVVPRDAAGHFDLRWFTPAIEVDLCGHATLATVHVLAQQGLVPTTGDIEFFTRSGQLKCCFREGLITLDFPASQLKGVTDAKVIASIRNAFAAEIVDIQQTAFDILLRLKDAAAVGGVRPNFRDIAMIDARGVMVTAPAPADTNGIDFVSRFFAPQSGIDEDPVTGSAHCALAPYWGREFGKTRLTGFQSSPRGGTVQCEVIGDRVKLSGHAVTVSQGHLMLQPS
jgi:PhzF family phenazine biosynthesis protein